jgi:ATP-dependent helicase HrpA
VEGDWESRLPFFVHNRRLLREVQELEHKARRQDVLVDDELIYAFYDRHVPAGVCSRRDAGALAEGPRSARGARACCTLSRDELMRHEAAGITTAAFPRIVRLGGIDCAAELPARARRRHATASR